MEKTSIFFEPGMVAVTDDFAAKKLGVSVDYVHEQIRSQKLRASFIGDRILIRPDSIVAFLQGQEHFETVRKHLGGAQRESQSTISPSKVMNL